MVWFSEVLLLLFRHCYEFNIDIDGYKPFYISIRHCLQVTWYAENEDTYDRWCPLVTHFTSKWLVSRCKTHVNGKMFFFSSIHSKLPHVRGWHYTRTKSSNSADNANLFTFRKRFFGFRMLLLIFASHQSTCFKMIEMWSWWRAMIYIVEYLQDQGIAMVG